jgi:hypothetical protein
MPRLELGARFRPVAVLTIALICAGCVPTIPYLSAGPHNMYVKTTTDAGEPLAAMRAWLEVQRVTPGCHGEVEGEIYLRGPIDSLYVSVGRPSNLAFKFRTSSLFSQTSGTTSYATLIRPRGPHESPSPIKSVCSQPISSRSHRKERRAGSFRDRTCPRALPVEATCGDPGSMSQRELEQRRPRGQPDVERPPVSCWC